MAATSPPTPPAGFSWVYYGKNVFLPFNHWIFGNDRQVTISFGADTIAAPAQRYGPYSHRFLTQFFRVLQSNMLFAQADGMSAATLANTIAHEHFPGAEKEFPVGVWDPIDHYIMSNDLLIMESPFTAQANPRNVDVKDVWTLADFLQGHAIKNVIGHQFFNGRSFQHPNDDPEDQRYLIDRELIEYCFDNKLWATQFGRTILYTMNRDIDFDYQYNLPTTPDQNVLPSYIEDLFRIPNGDRNYLPWYFNLCHLLLIEEKRPRDAVTTAESNDEDSIQYFCGVTHHHPSEPRCGASSIDPQISSNSGTPLYYLGGEGDDDPEGGEVYYVASDDDEA